MQLEEALKQYRNNFTDTYWQNVKCRWECVKCFQDHWKPEDPSIPFPDMLVVSFGQIEGLSRLVNADSVPFSNMINLAKKVPAEVRALFDLLFDERTDLWERIHDFQTRMLSLFETQEGDISRFYFSETTVSILLWLRYPWKYHIYRFWEAKTLAEGLQLPYTFAVGADEDNIRNACRMYDHLREAVCQEEALISQMRNRLDDACWPDQECGILASDIAANIAAAISSYLTTPDQNDRQNDGHNTRPTERFFAGLSARDWAKLLADEHIFLLGDMEMLRKMKDQKCWRSYDELPQTSSDPADPTHSANTTYPTDTPRPTDSTKKTAPTEKRDTENAREKRGTENYNKKVISLSWRLIHKTGCPTNVTKGVLHEECRIDGEAAWRLRGGLSQALYTTTDFLSEVYMTREQFARLKNLVTKKKNVILQGAPGVGKTFTAKRLVYSLMKVKDDDRICFIQFHQSYSYEDFVMGYRPSGDGFQLQYGVFYRFCRKAAACPNQDFFFIIDEINRGNISKIFGELLMLIERDYRGTEAVLAYDGKPFSVPENLYIIGMMNTADRSLAMIDYALRRRFSFFEIAPGFDSDGFRNYQQWLNNPHFDALIAEVKALNEEIAEDLSLGRGFCIGHSYFCGCETPADCTDEWMKSVVDYDILPMLEEYWIDDDREKQITWQRRLHDIFEK